MSNYNINDEWILNRISKQSTSFSSWISSLKNVLSKSLENVDPKQLGRHGKNEIVTSLDEVENNLLEAKEELSKLGLGGMFSKFGALMGNYIKKQIGDTIKEDDLFDLDFITGKKKSLSGALYDVSKEKGIEETGLLYLIKALPDLEAFLYSTSVQKYYRDHTEHALRVAVLGDFLLSQDLGQGKLSKVIADKIELDETFIREKLWWLIGLLHDIGYPLGKMTTAVNYSLLNQVLKCYPTLDLEIQPLQIGLSWKGNLEDYMQILEQGMSDKARDLFRTGVGPKTRQVSQYQTFLQQQAGHPEYRYSEQFEFDHGVLSALCLLNGLGTPEVIKKNDENRAYVLVAQAIALHSFKDHLSDHSFEKRPLGFLLILVDELQEWGRPIPIKVQDSYFTTDVKKENLLDGVLLYLDEFKWNMEFRNDTAKKLSNFDFNRFSLSKKESFERLERGNEFKSTTIHLKDIKIADKEGKQEKILSENKIII
ncbi:MAG: hypothetical protein EU530_01660 [Promethearchaeota archaeon]|nr:MAG: hypothetical protein EU530_01660 [Candidatus Lokiarchaeota archaeon]